MPTGYFALVLHAHLPFVRHPEDPTVMEEQWLYEAITGTYLPLIQMFEGLIVDHIPYRATVSLSAPLITMLADDRAVEQLMIDERLAERLPRGAIHLSMSTIAPRTALRLAALHRERGSRYVASPVFGKPEVAEKAKLWIVTASDHRFSDNLGEFDARLLEALAWVRQQGVR